MQFLLYSYKMDHFPLIPTGLMDMNPENQRAKGEETADSIGGSAQTWLEICDFKRMVIKQWSLNTNKKNTIVCK